MDLIQVGNKKDTIQINIKSAETSVVINQGTPIFFAMNGTDDGLAVVSDEAISAAGQGFFAGIATQALQPSQLGKAHAWGEYDFATIILMTRSATTAIWPSYPAGAFGDILCFSSAASCQGFYDSAAGSATAAGIFAKLIGSWASFTTQASSLVAGSGLLALTKQLKVYIRAL